MKNNSPLFIEYREIRRRIEGQLSSIRAVVGHLFLYLGCMFAIQMSYNIKDYAQIDTRLGLMMMFWSFLLLGHGVWVYWKSGTSGKARETIIKQQLEERLDKDDTELLNNPRDAFRLHSLLEADIRKRSGAFMATFVFLGLNAMMWFTWLVQGRYSSYPWKMVLPMAFMFLVPAAIINFLRRTDRELTYRVVLDNWSSQANSGTQQPKQKRNADQATVRLSDDGELIEDYLSETRKAKHSS